MLEFRTCELPRSASSHVLHGSHRRKRKPIQIVSSGLKRRSIKWGRNFSSLAVGPIGRLVLNGQVADVLKPVPVCKDGFSLFLRFWNSARIVWSFRNMTDWRALW